MIPSTDAHPPRKRFQFSLRTLMFAMIGMGLIGLIVKLSFDNSRLREENLSMREELGYLNIGDPTKIWARGSKLGSLFHQHFQIYIPTDMVCRIGVAGNNISDQGYEPNWIGGFGRGPFKKGEIVNLNVDISRNLDGKLIANISMSGGTARVDLPTPLYGGEWPGSFSQTTGCFGTSRTFSSEVPFDLIRTRSVSDTNPSTSATTGLVVFFVPNCSPQHPFGPKYP